MPKSKGRGKGVSKKSPKQVNSRSSSGRPRTKSRRLIDSEEYLSASEFPADIIIHGSNDTVDTMTKYEDSILEDSIFEDNTENDSEWLPPGKNISSPRRYVSESEDLDLGYLNNLSDLHDFHGSFPILFDGFCNITESLPDITFVNSDIVDAVKDIIDIVAEEIPVRLITDDMTLNNCVKCENFNVTLDRSKTKMTELSKALIVAKQQNAELLKEGNILNLNNSMLSQQLIQQEEIQRKYLMEIKRLEEAQATSEYVITVLEKNVETKNGELSEMERKLETKSDEMSMMEQKLEEKLETMNDELSEMEKKLKIKSDEMTVMQQNLDEKLENKNKNDELSAMKRQLEMKNSEITIMQQNLEFFMDKNIKMKNELKVIKNTEQADLENPMLEMSRKLDQLHAELSNQTQTIGETITGYLDEITDQGTPRDSQVQISSQNSVPEPNSVMNYEMGWLIPASVDQTDLVSASQNPAFDKDHFNKNCWLRQTANLGSTSNIETEDEQSGSVDNCTLPPHPLLPLNTVPSHPSPDATPN